MVFVIANDLLSTGLYVCHAGSVAAISELQNAKAESFL